MRTVLIVVDGMRPDAIAAMPRVQKLLKNASYTMTATTVMPSVTLPCHMSLFHSVDPSRHGTTTNTYAPQVRPINGLCEVLLNHKKTCAFLYRAPGSRKAELAFVLLLLQRRGFWLR